LKAFAVHLCVIEGDQSRRILKLYVTLQGYQNKSDNCMFKLVKGNKGL